ncbi:MAG: MAC/perforin domain-containing protein [Gammaproteobacteria bacterium]|nr:MAC/perforin domain-containing protein [Gammaproteobacteria bacterium]
MFLLNRLLQLLVTTSLIAGAGIARAQDAIRDPVDIFAGCDADQRAPSQEAPRDRMTRRAAPTVDRITERSFASFSLDDIEAGVPDDMASLCWARLDGVWRAVSSVTLDRSKDNPGIWGADAPELVSMANGNYTTPRHLVVVASADPAKALHLATGLGRAPFVRFQSNDGLALADVLERGGPVKEYRAASRFEFGQRLRLDVTRTGRVRLMLDAGTFVRPQPGVSQATMAAQVASDDAFLLSYNLDNLAASRRGYDLIQQDTFDLLQNNKQEVFARVDPRNYYITEKRTVPVGLTLIQEGKQGTVYRKSLVTSESELQTTTTHTFGFSLEASVPSPNPNVAAFEASAGYESTKSTMRSMRQSESVAQAIAYSRYKQYALVLDHPYLTLSDPFIDAVEDARRYHRYQALINRFGTHYPYAVTYGATAKMTQSFTESSYTERAREEDGYSRNAGAKLYGNGGSVHHSRMAGETTGTSGSIGSEGATFVAVGGNGSWDQGGYSAGGTPYPILLDLRPLHELLNPMNFPGEPEIYQTVRDNLERAIVAYLQKNSARLDNASLLPEVLPKPPPAAKPPPKPVRTKVFRDPKVAKRWLDLCYAKGSCRTQQAVNAFCRLKGYARATYHNSAKVKLGHTNVRIGDGSKCRAIGRKCHRIIAVTCSG